LKAAGQARGIAAGLAVNAGLGVLYIWSLFLAPLESELATDRATLSLVPALALVGFTVGMVLYAGVLRRLSVGGVALLSLGLAGAGHVLFGLFPSVPTLLVGYSALFGIGGGLGYLLALGLATRSEERMRSIAVGITVATFAASGVVLAFFIPGIVARTSAASTFLFIGIALWVIGAIVAILLRGITLATDAGPQALPVRYASSLFLQLALAFFAVCAVGLMVVAHSTGILVAIGAGTAASLGPIVYNIGYIIGCLTGGKISEIIGGRLGLGFLNLLIAVAMPTLALSAPVPAALLALGLVGAALGGVASMMPMIIARFYGVERLGAIYGKLNIAYGLGGLIAPWIAGILYVRSGSYAGALYLGLGLATIGILVSLTIPSGARAGDIPTKAA
jgi:MFS family permease